MKHHQRLLCGQHFDGSSGSYGSTPVFQGSEGASGQRSWPYWWIRILAKFFGGYQLTEHFGVQAGYVRMHDLNQNTGAG